MNELWKVIRHNQALAAAVVICMGLLYWTYGCVSKVASLKDPAAMVSREELQLEVKELSGDFEQQLDLMIDQAELKFDKLDQKDEFKHKVFELAKIGIEEGKLDKAGIIGLVGWVLFGGAAIDNRRKDGVINGEKKAENS